MIRLMASEPTMGKRIRRARERKRWTQQQLADALKVGLRTVNDWENDRSYPRNSVGALEDILGVSLDDDHAFKPIPPEFRRLIEQWLPDPEDQRRVIGLLEGTLTWPAEGDSSAEQPPDDSRPQAL